MSHTTTQKISFAGLLITTGIVFGDIGTSPLYVFQAITGGGKHISEPFIFETLKNNTSVAIVRFYYTFTLGPKSSRPQSVLMKFQSSSTSAGWQLADFIMPNNESLVDLFEKNP